jgi:DNA primase
MQKLDPEIEYQKLLKKIDVEKFLDIYDIRHRRILGSHGPEFVMRCPFPEHDDRSPSFCLNERTGIYNCFVCGGGNLVTMVQKMEGIKSFFKALQEIKNKFGIVEENSIDSFDVIESKFEETKEKKAHLIRRKIDFKNIELPESVPANECFEITKKRVTLEMIKQWNLRYCIHDTIYKGKYDGRLIIPIECYDKITTFAARDMLGKWEEWKKKLEIAEQELTSEQLDKFILKYEVKKILYPYGSQTNLIFFNWDEAIKNSEYVIICEGAFDAMKVVMNGYNAIALLSCNLNPFRANKIRKHFKTVYICLDNDDKINKKGKRINPGQEHAIKILKERLDGMTVYNIVLPFGKDPDECSKEEFDVSFREAKNFFKIW